MQRSIGCGQRLLNQARRQGEDYQILLTRCGLPRLLYRLSLTAYRDSYPVKGAVPFLFSEGAFHRTKRDQDLLALGSNAIDRLVTISTLKREARINVGVRITVRDDIIVLRRDAMHGGMKL